MSGIPEAIRAMAEFPPTEDVFLPLLRARLTGVPVQSLIQEGQTFPFVLIRRDTNMGTWDGDERFIDSALLHIHAYAQDPDGDQDAAILAEAVRVAMKNIEYTHDGVDGLGYVVACTMLYPPRRSPDWATSSGPVQYADLPTGVWRYEATYDVKIRRPL